MIARRQFLHLATATAYISSMPSLHAFANESPSKFTMDLCPGRIGVQANQRESISLAKAHGFQSVEPLGAELARLSAGERKDLLGQLKSQGLVWGAAGLDVDFRGSDKDFLAGMASLPANAASLNQAGVDRVGTWLSPAHQDLTYLANFRQHVARLKEIAKVYNDNGIRFGLEYVGPKTLWASKRYAFIHTMQETKELISETQAPNLGLVLDSWHWYTAGESEADLMTLTNRDVVAIDLNDAPAGLERDQQLDNRRELPSATGVIDIKTFMRAVRAIGYDGPIRAEPFNQTLNELGNEEAVRATAEAMAKAMSA
jgi:sugar phosphate isomerase/epimerase